MRAAIYLRVSSEMQLEGFSLEAQEAASRALITARGWTLAEVYKDEGRSAKTTERPAFQAMMADARAARFDAVVVHKLDRLSRSIIDLLLIAKELEALKISFVSATEQFDFTSPIGKVLFALLAAFAQWYLDNLAAETAKGHHARAAAGHRHGSIPFGYYTHYMKEGGEGLALIDENEAAGVRMAFNAALTKGDTAVALLLNEHGYRPTGRNGPRALTFWTKDSVSYMLQNPFYTGRVRYRKQLYEGVHEPIISDELFNAVQEARSRRRLHNRGGGSGTPSLLSGLARCVGCGLSMRIIRAQRHNYYACLSQRRGRLTRCTKPYAAATAVDEAMGRIIAAIRLPDHWREEVMRQLEQPEEPGARSREQTLAALQRELDANKTMFRLGHIAEREYTEEHARLTRAITALEAPARAAEKPLAVGELLENIEALWQQADDESRHQLLVSLFDEIVIDSENPNVIVAVRPLPAAEPLIHYLAEAVDILPSRS